MSLPLILLCGNAGAGKDTVAGILAETRGAVRIAQADPLKRMARELFGFSENALWGPSEERNREVPVNPLSRLDEAKCVLTQITKDGYLPARLTSAFQRWYFDLTAPARPLAPRHVLQTLGTEVVRKNLGSDVWVNLAIRDGLRLLEGGWQYDRVDAGAIHTDEPRHAAPMVVVSDGRFRNEIIAFKRAGGMAVLVEGRNGAAASSTHSSERELDSIPRHFYDCVIWNGGSQADLRRAVQEFLDVHFPSQPEVFG